MSPLPFSLTSLNINKKALEKKRADKQEGEECRAEKPTNQSLAGWQMCCCYTQAAGQSSDHWPGKTKNNSHEQRDLSKHRLGSGGAVLEGAFIPSFNPLSLPQSFPIIQQQTSTHHTQWLHCF